MNQQVLLVTRADEAAKRLALLLEQEAGCRVTTVNTCVGGVRELQGGDFDLVAVDMDVQREKDGLKLVLTLLVEKKTSRVPPVVVVTERQDPDVIRSCAQAGVADYVLIPEDLTRLKDLVGRLTKVLEETRNVGSKVTRICAVYLGPAAKVLVTKGAQRLKLEDPSQIETEHLPELLGWIESRARPVLRDKTPALLRRLESAFGVKRRAA